MRPLPLPTESAEWGGGAPSGSASSGFMSMLSGFFCSAAPGSSRMLRLMNHQVFRVPGWSWVFLALLCCTSRADDWPQWLGPQRDAVWRETGILRAFPPEGPKVLWRAPVRAGYSGPAVSGGRVYLTDRQVARGDSAPANPFDRGKIRGTERILCLNESDGAVLWEHEYACAYDISYPAGPRATPIVSEGKVFTLGAEGHLFSLDAATGKVIWSRELRSDFGIETPLWGFSAHPLLEGNLLICLVGGDGTTAVAFDKHTGKEVWRALSAKQPGYAPPMIFEAGGTRQLIIWHPESINALNPKTGELYWSIPFEVRSGLSVPSPRQFEDMLLVSSFYNGSMMLKLASDKPDATLLWRGKSNSERNTDGLHSIMPTPFIEGGYIYGVCSYGQLRCLKADTGERVWETLRATTPDEKQARWANAFLIKHEARFFLWNEKGDLIIAELTPAGYKEISRAHLLEPTNTAAGRDVLWSHPAFANRNMYARNDRELICVSLAE
jgi:outer membrane protein assembly factor BamB